MHPRIKVLLIGMIFAFISGAIGLCLNGDWRFWFLIPVYWAPVLAIPVHFLLNFEKNFQRWQKETDLQDADARYDEMIHYQCNMIRSGREISKNDNEMATAFIKSAFCQKHTKKEFAEWILEMSVFTILASWFLIFLSHSFDAEA
ncbi:MAG: hypothetical protein A2V69_00760 [Candidatus Portnoybacteria bacterium RBG_13_40_8]|uniref:Uncharacterized protein n=1 Tax=Candidatus Portnoybacteria bacterium RBG_13_40_8 TaxID=1801990 RepID=A0A1G2F3Z8_9BACT|nr:MAG: hypothetical protein A2V69_00760 [Candidatus Portnoybacteria bacterium RBG_13_40_8]OGZ34522.1 MAG: hypothetical protein A2V60_03070 [Candidatus Portnoybacteria bacterium RIFCSPHIGHO2_01_FULL_39_19]